MAILTLMFLRIIVRIVVHAVVLVVLVVASIGLVTVGSGTSLETASWAVYVGAILFGGSLLLAVPPIAEWLLRRLGARFAEVKRDEEDSVRELQLRARQRRRERRGPTGGDAS